MAGKGGTVTTTVKTAQTPPGYACTIHFPANGQLDPPQVSHDEDYTLDVDEWKTLSDLPAGSTVDTTGSANGPIGGITVHK